MIPLFKIYKPVIDYNKFDHNLHGSIVTEFENAFAEYVGYKYAIGTNSCTSAIYLVMKWFNELYGPRKIKIPTMLPPVVYNALHHAGSNIEFMDYYMWIGDSYEFINEHYLIRDCAHLAPYKKKSGWDDIRLYSFYPTKPCAGIDGGMVLTNDTKLYNWLRIATKNGMVDNKKYCFPGWKYYMSSAQAYVAYNSFKFIELKKEKLNQIREQYDSLNILSCLIYPSDHLYVIEVDDNKKFIKYMEKNGVQCGIHYKCLHRKLHKEYSPDPLPNSLRMENRVVSIPFHEDLTKKDIKYIAGLINEYNK